MTFDLGLTGRPALVCGASAGLGRACATSLARAGATVTIVGRRSDAIERAAEELSASTGSAVTPVTADVTTVDGRRAMLEAVPGPDILVTNAAGPPVGDVLDFDDDAWRQAFETNMLSHLSLIRAVVGPMRERRYGRIVNITSGAVKSPLPFLGLSVGARLALTGAVAVLARQVAADNVAINNVLPGSFLTDRLRSNLATTGDGDLDEALRSAAAGIPAGRIGDPAELGDLCAFLCSPSAGYIIGQNILIDGGKFNATLA